MRSNQSGHMLFKAADRLASRQGSRIDLRFADARPRGKASADFLVRYNPGNGVPTRTEIAAFITKQFDGRLTPQTMLDHGQVSRDHAVLHVSADVHRDRLSVDHLEADKASYRDIDGRGVRFLHTKTAQVWNVEKGADGTPVLFREEEDDLEDLVRSARKARLTTAMPGCTFDQIGLTAGANVYDVGDTVAYHCQGTRCTGRVTNIDRGVSGNTKLHVENAQTGTLDTIPEGLVLECITKAPGVAGAEKGKLMDYYSKMYGDRSFAEKLVR